MNKIIITLLSVILSTQFIESRPRYGYGSWRKFVRSSEESSEESFASGSQLNIGNGYKNRNEIHYNHSPNSNRYQGHTENTEMYEEVEEQGENEGQFVNRGGYRTTPNQDQEYNTFSENGSQISGGSGGGYRNNNSQRPFRTNGRQIHINGGPYDYETNNSRNRPSEIGRFGNGHNNRNTFNIHKKDIYIS